MKVTAIRYQGAKYVLAEWKPVPNEGKILLKPGEIKDLYSRLVGIQLADLPKATWVREPGSRYWRSRANPQPLGPLTEFSAVFKNVSDGSRVKVTLRGSRIPYNVWGFEQL
jgi:hypothetical protein